MSCLLGFGESLFSPSHILLLLLVGVLLFGRRLPDFGRVIGKAFRDFKMGMSGLEDNLHEMPQPADRAALPPVKPPARVPTAAPKFEAGDAKAVEG